MPARLSFHIPIKALIQKPSENTIHIIPFALLYFGMSEISLSLTSEPLQNHIGFFRVHAYIPMPVKKELNGIIITNQITFSILTPIIKLSATVFGCRVNYYAFFLDFVTTSIILTIAEPSKILIPASTKKLSPTSPKIIYAPTEPNPAPVAHA